MINIGVTGHRYLVKNDLLQAGIDQALLRIEGIYPQNSWTILSSLAEGADQFVIDRVLEFKPDIRVIVPMPLQTDEYIDSFFEEGAKTKFNHLLQIATKIIPPKADWSKQDGYWETGKYIVEHCEVLIALWDGQTSHGRGGTGDVVSLAIAGKKPLVWVHCSNGNPENRQNKNTPFKQGYTSFLNFPERTGNYLKTIKRDFSIILSSIWINLVLFLALIGLGTFILKATGSFPDAGWPQLILYVFHMAGLEPVETNNQLVPILLSFLVPLVTVFILGEGVLRVLPIYLQRHKDRREWDLMVIKTFSDHTIVGGTGEMGKALVRQILSDKPDAQLVLIDPRAGILTELGVSSDNTAFLQADMTDIDILVKAGINKANLVILTAGEDAHNLEAAYKVLKINPKIDIWIRLHHSGLADLLDLSRKPNIHFFCPYQQAASSITKQLLSYKE